MEPEADDMYYRKNGCFSLGTNANVRFISSYSFPIGWREITYYGGLHLPIDVVLGLYRQSDGGDKADCVPLNCVAPSFESFET